MAKKQTRRSISVSRSTYERLKSYCETNQISMSQFVERRVGDYLGRSKGQALPATEIPSAPARPAAVLPTVPVGPSVPLISTVPSAHNPRPHSPAPQRAVTVDRPLSTPVAASSPRPTRSSSEEPMVKDPDVKLTADQIFTF